MDNKESKFSWYQWVCDITRNPLVVYSVLTFVGFIAISIAGGLKTGFLVLGIWSFILMAGYTFQRYG